MKQRNIALAALAALGVLMERFVFRPFQKEFDRVVMVSVAIMTMLQQLAVQQQRQKKKLNST